MTIKTIDNFEFELGALPLEYLTTAIRRRIRRMLSNLSSEDLVQLMNEGMKAEEEDTHGEIIPIFTLDELDVILHACWVARHQPENNRMADRLWEVIQRIKLSNTPKTLAK